MAVEQIQSVEDLETTTVDADFHLTEQVSDFAPYLEPPWNKFMEGDNPFDENAEFYDPFPSPGQISTLVMSGRSQIFSPDRVRDVNDIREGLDMIGIDRALITPGATILKLGLVHNDDFAAAIASAFNQFMLEEVADESEDLYVPITVAGGDPTKAAEEIDDLKDESAVSCVFFPNSVNPPLGHKWFNPMWEAIDRADLPFVMHGGGGTNTLSSFPVQYDWMTTGIEDHVIGHSFQHIVNVVSLLAQGIPERYDVDLLFQEAGLGWVPYYAHRMNNEYFQKRDQAPLLTKPPGDYMLEDFYYTTQPLEGHAEDPEYVRQISRLINADETVMFSSDYPHQDFDHADTIFNIYAQEFEREELERIFGGNAMDVFFS